MTENWNGIYMQVNGIQFIAEETESRFAAPGLKQLSSEHSTQLGKLTKIFDEESLLSEQQKADRALARKWKVSIGDAEVLRHQFNKYDLDGSGEIDKDEFSCILRELIKCKNADDIPQERFDHYWREIDFDQSGVVDFEEFLLWYPNIVKSGH